MKLLPGLILLVSTVLARAGFPLIVDDSGADGPGTWEVEFDGGAQREKGDETATATVALTTGLTSWLEGSFDAGYGGDHRHHTGAFGGRDGILDISLGGKIPLLDSTKAPLGLAVSSTVILPTAEQGLGEASTNVNVLLLATRDWNPSVSTDVNAGFNWATGSGVASDAEDAAFLGAAIRWKTSKQWTLFVESYASLPVHAVGEAQQILRCGFAVECRKNVFLSAAVATGYGETRYTGATVGVNFVF